MGKETDVQWTDASWNIGIGCTKVDAECKFCYMYRDSMNGTRFNPFEVVKTKTVFNLPLKLKKPSRIFTCSWTDFFHEGIDSYRHEAWDIIRQCPQHTFQILTKRPERILQCLPEDWGEGWDNVWLGTSCGSQLGVERIYKLCEVPAKTRFVSFEPLIQAIDNLPWGAGFPVDYDASPVVMWSDLIHWAIVGGESGNEKGKYLYRPCELSWMDDLVTACENENIPVFVKQMGTHLQKQMGMKERHGGNIEEFPEWLKIREFPKH